MQWIIESGVLLVLTLAMAMAMFRVFLAFYCRYYVSFLFVELALIIEWIPTIHTSIRGCIYISS